MSQYQDYSKVWATQYQESLFVVKIPAAINALDEQTYTVLMQLRVSWLIQRWMEEGGNTQTEIQRLLVTTLSQLHPSQDHPLMNQNSSGEAIDLKEWRDSWAATFILYNERFSEALSLQGASFPVQPLTEAHSEFQRLMEIHQDTHLEEWLLQLFP